MNSRSLPFFLLFFFSFIKINFAQSVTGTLINGSQDPGTSIVVDNSVTIIYAGDIVNANVIISTNYQVGDNLSIDAAMLPRGVSSSFDPDRGLLTLTGTGSAAQWQDALRTVQFTAGINAYGTKQVSFTLGRAIYYATNGHYYEEITSTMPWTDGRAAAASQSLFGLTGYLATLTNDNENNFVSTELRSIGWIGNSDDYIEINTATGTTTYADQEAAEGHWYWVCGPEKGALFSNGNTPFTTTVTYSRWNVNEPNNSGNEHYGQLLWDRMAWNDLPNSPILPLVVEYGGMPGDPVIDISHTRAIEILVPTLSGNDNTQAYFTNNDIKYPVDPTVHFSNAVSITDVTINISGGYTDGDFLDIDPGLIPADVTSYYYDTNLGAWFFQGTASAEDWKKLMASVTFRTTSADLSNRTVTFNAGNLPGNAEGHFYLPADIVPFDYNSMATFFYRQDLATFNGLKGYAVNISSAAENESLKKFQQDFWLPLTDDYDILNQLFGGIYDGQYQTEGRFYSLAGPGAGTLISTGNNGSMVPEGGQFNNWADTEPSDISANPNITEVGNSVYYSVLDGKWYNDKLTGTQPEKTFLIEYGGTPGDPPVFTLFTKTMSLLGVLPVTLTKFGVKMTGKTVLAEWQTSAEKNNAYFNLERSADNNHFTTIGRIEGGGTSNYTRTYQFTDQQPLPGINYYRLKQVDIDNHFVYSPINKIEFSTGDRSSRIFPSLVVTDFTVQRPNSGTARCLIITAAGSVVQRVTSTGSVFTVNVSSLPKGAYIFRIINTEYGGKEENIRFVKY